MGCQSWPNKCLRPQTNGVYCPPPRRPATATTTAATTCADPALLDFSTLHVVRPQPSAGLARFPGPGPGAQASVEVFGTTAAMAGAASRQHRSLDAGAGLCHQFPASWVLRKACTIDYEVQCAGPQLNSFIFPLFGGLVLRLYPALRGYSCGRLVADLAWIGDGHNHRQCPTFCTGP